MSNLKLFSRAFSMLLLAIAAVLAQSPLKSTSPAAATVSGRALLKDKPARNIVIGLQEAQPGSPPGQVLRATTGENGRFRSKLPRRKSSSAQKTRRRSSWLSTSLEYKRGLGKTACRGLTCDPGVRQIIHLSSKNFYLHTLQIIEPGKKS